jgi:hypothetical protein
MHSRRYVAAVRRDRRARIEAAPPRPSLPTNWKLELQSAPHGRIVFLRRTNAHGELSLLGRTWRIAPVRRWGLLRIEADLVEERIRFFALCRRSPLEQPLLLEARFQLPSRPFQGDL